MTEDMYKATDPFRTPFNLYHLYFNIYFNYKVVYINIRDSCIEVFNILQNILDVVRTVCGNYTLKPTFVVMN